METVNLTIDGQAVGCPAGSSILEAAQAAGIYIPRICHHPDLPSAGETTWAATVHQVRNLIEGEKTGVMAGDEAHCGLCLVQVDGQTDPIDSCHSIVEDGLAVKTNTETVVHRRQQALSRILTDHPHSCLTCAQKVGCSRTDCSMNVPVDERCCSLLGNCELEKVADFIGIPDYTPRYVPQGRAKSENDPLFNRDFELCIGCTRCVRVCHEVQEVDVLGAVWKDGRAWVGTLDGGDLKEAQCRFCGACVEICPTGALLDKEGAEPVRCNLELPCVAHCPAGIDVPRYLAAIAAGQDQQALKIIRDRVPFPGILGYACFRPCEVACRRSDVDQPVAICALKRYVADAESNAHTPQVEKSADTGKKVAIIGSGPAGLTAAYYLSELGHQVDIFDRESHAGGMLRYGIPDYRLPREVLDRELKPLTSLGVNFHLKYNLDNEPWLEHLKSRDFDAILVAVGVSAGRNLSIENSHLTGIYQALEFLKSAKTSQTPHLEGQVAIIGGGNVAIDAAMTALRLGANSATMICLESRDSMPAHHWEIAQAEEEGVEVLASWGPEKFTSDNGLVSGIELKRCTRVFDAEGIFHPQYDETQIKHVTANSVIVAIGQSVDLGFASGEPGLTKSAENTLKINNDMSVGVDGVFAAGDVTHGPSSIVDAIADGRRAAEKIDLYLGGNGIVPAEYVSTGNNFPKASIPIDLFSSRRQDGGSADPQERKLGFAALQQTLTEQQARSEASRCLQCFLRQQITPVVLPPEQWQPFNDDSIASVPECEGVLQLLNADKKVISISGTPNLRQRLQECLENAGEAKWFTWEQDPMFTQRESELIQQYLQKYGELPKSGTGDDDLDDLF